MFEENSNKYLYRRQYVLGPRPVELQGNWKTIQVSKDYALSFHPDLPVTSVCSPKKSIHLLGYIIDSKNPSFDDEQIVRSIIDKSKVADDVFENLADKCGRFVVIVKIGDEFRIFSDACGLRQVFFHIDNAKLAWCASQPHLIAEQLGIEINEKTKQDLLKTPLLKSNNYWFPGTITLFNEVSHLIPNNYLDIYSGKVYRYWPRNVLTPITMSECIPIVSEILSNIIEGASNRFNLAFAISSGLDSRTLFSTSRKYAKKIQFFTLSSPDSINSSPDVYIPQKMLKDLGLKHHILSIPEKIDDQFSNILQKTIFWGRISKGMNALSVYNQFKTEKKEILVIFGNCSEITKRDRFRFPKTPKPFITGTTLATMAQMTSSDVAKSEFSKWVTSVKKLTKYNINILDLMHWEQRVGNWAAMSLSEYEIIHESLCPYSCRRYIEYMLRVPFKYRTNPDYKLHHSIISANWPEALNYDINPASNKIKKSLENFLYKTSVYDPIQFLNIMFIKRYRSSDLT